MKIHLTKIEERNRHGARRVHYEIREGQVVLKRGSGWGVEGAESAARRALQRLQAKSHP